MQIKVCFVALCCLCTGHARARDEEVVSASQVYFMPNPPRYPPPGQPPCLSLRHIVDMVRWLFPWLKTFVFLILTQGFEQQQQINN